VDVRARITSKGRVTIPASVREALDLHEGDELVFRVEEGRAVIGKTPDFLALACRVPVPAAERATPSDEVLRATWRERGSAVADGVRRRQRPHPPAGDPPSRSRRATAVLASLDLLLLADVVLAKCVFVLASFCGLSERGSRR
jgi:antitoxin PrlF